MDVASIGFATYAGVVRVAVTYASGLQFTVSSGFVQETKPLKAVEEGTLPDATDTSRKPLPPAEVVLKLTKVVGQLPVRAVEFTTRLLFPTFTVIGVQAETQPPVAYCT